MWALIGLFIGAAAGNFIGHDWGAVLGGLAGFFIGALFAGSRQRANFRKPDPVTSLTPMPGRPEMRSLAHDGEWLRRIAALEQRVAGLEQAARSVTGALNADDARPASPVPITPTEIAATAPAARATASLADPWLRGADGTLQPGPAAMG
ncbi:MAG: SoxR reducing system RseC family protein, partial [Aromatoleum sp.]|nr:SoxR reducing system RseC family protein [Aromatoleum sp.]